MARQAAVPGSETGHPVRPLDGAAAAPSRRVSSSRPAGIPGSSLPDGAVPSPPSSRERAVAGNPSPDPGASLRRTGHAPGRGRAQDPAGGTPSPREATADDGPPAGTRTYTITLPPGLKLLSLNDRGHWAARYRRSEILKKAAWATALNQKIPRLERVSVVAEYQPPDRRHRDADNPVASVKAAIDGIVAAGCLPGDESPQHVASVTCRIGEPHPKGRLVLHLTEVPALRGNHPAGRRLPPHTPDGGDAA